MPAFCVYFHTDGVGKSAINRLLRKQNPSFRAHSLINTAMRSFGGRFLGKINAFWVDFFCRFLALPRPHAPPWRRVPIVCLNVLVRSIQDALESPRHPGSTGGSGRGLAGDLCPPGSAAGGQPGHAGTSRVTLGTCIQATKPRLRSELL